METMKVIKINSRGQIVLPVEFRKILGIDENTQMLVRMLDDGGLEIRPASIVPISNYLESHPQVRKKGSLPIDKPKWARCSARMKQSTFWKPTDLDQGVWR
jgi:AbrB family looped-hinge helix DNA binding protein